MHYVRTLCDKYFVSYDGFSSVLTGRFRHMVLKHGVGIDETQGKLLHRSHSIFMGFTLILCYLSSKFHFSGTAYHRDLKPVQLDLGCLKP